MTPVSQIGLPADPPYWSAAFDISASLNAGRGLPVTVTWALATSGATPGGAALRPLTAGEEANIRASLAAAVEGSGLRLVEAAPATAQILIGASSAPSGWIYGLTWPSLTGPTVVVAYDSVYADPSGLARNNYIYLHEVLHAFGLNHSTAMFGATGPVVIPAEEVAGTTLYGQWGQGWTGGVQIFDLAAMQYLYGPDPALRAGNDVYRPGVTAFDPYAPTEDGPLLWDGAGYDAIDLSAQTLPVNASLVPGVLSQIGTQSSRILDPGTFSINYGTVIEALIGGQGDDTLTGGVWASALEGGGGNDRLTGQGATDRLAGARARTVCGAAGAAIR